MKNEIQIKISEEEILSLSPRDPSKYQILYHLNHLINLLEQTNVGVETTSIRKWLLDIGSKT